ncbi:MAG: hypothetical protein JSV58_01510 [Candidatus Bathyarchaeota archaeon]|nr:MAG: hypothetical protein JSV58_01510 [Candidatus Bathyarchaeota archaeon]
MRKGTVAYSVVLLLILASLVAFAPPAAAVIEGSIKWDPYKVDLSLPSPSTFTALIRFESGEGGNPRDINASTVLLEGSLAPDATIYVPGAVEAEFDGTGVVNILWGEITHLGQLAPPYKIWLTITGKLIDSAGATPFSCTGEVKLIVHHSPPPP